MERSPNSFAVETTMHFLCVIVELRVSVKYIKVFNVPQQRFTVHLYHRQQCKLYEPVLGAFAKLREATISFVISVRLFVCPHGTTRLPLDGF